MMPLRLHYFLPSFALMSTFSDDVFLPGLRPLLPDSFRSLKKEKMRFKYNKLLWCTVSIMLIF